MPPSHGPVCALNGARGHNPCPKARNGPQSDRMGRSGAV
jgi:hypothetical protein